MKISKEDIVITIAMVAVVGCVVLGVKLITANKTINDNESYDIKLQHQNDSLINSNISHIVIVGNKDRKEADSLLDIVKAYKTADSLNKIKYPYEKNKVKSYTPKQLNSAYDSIFGPSK